MPFIWDATRARYRDADTKRFVSAKQVADLAQASLEETGKIASGIQAKELGTVLRAEIKKETVRQYLLGRGGVKQMTPRDWGRIGASVAEQYGYLDDFIKEADQLSEAQIASRVQMYINSAREGFEKGKAEAIKQSGEFTEERWVMDTSKENCSGCQALAAKGWVKIGELGTFPGSGDTPCLTKCGCKIEYR